MADREGFEPSLHCCKHAFQACAFDHSATCPLPPFLRRVASFSGAKPACKEGLRKSREFLGGARLASLRRCAALVIRFPKCKQTNAASLTTEVEIVTCRRFFRSRYAVIFSGFMKNAGHTRRSLPSIPNFHHGHGHHHFPHLHRFQPRHLPPLLFGENFGLPVIASAPWQYAPAGWDREIQKL